MILLVNPNNRIMSSFAGLEPPVWLGMIASDLRSKGNEVQILDAEAENLTTGQTCQRIRELKPKEAIIVCMGNNPSVSSTPKMVAAKKIVDNLIGEYNVKITGLHTSALPRESKDELGIEVLRGKIFDGTPDLPWDLYPMDKYVAHNWHCLHDMRSRQPYAAIYTSLGCLSGCSFCNIPALYGYQKKVWYRPVENVIKEVNLLLDKYGVHNIKLWDEHFTQNHARVNQICDGLRKRGHELNIWAYARVDTVNQELLDKMWYAGINWVAYGFESACDRVLGNVNKHATRLQAIKAVNMAHESGINIIGNFIFGLEGDDAESMQETLDFAKSLNIEFANFYCAEKLPGAQIYDGNKDWSSFGQYSPTAPITQASLFRDKAFKEYYTDANYLSHILKRFGPKSVEHINAMVQSGRPVTKVS